MTKFCKEKFKRLPSDKRRHILYAMTRHFAKGNDFEKLKHVLTCFDFLEAKISDQSLFHHAGVSSPLYSLLTDYDLALQDTSSISGQSKESLRLIQQAIRLSASVLSEAPEQLAGQLIGRLIKSENPEIKELLRQAENAQDKPWIRPLTASLRSTKDGLYGTLSGHEDAVTSVAISSDRQWIISGSADKTLNVWKFETGQLSKTLKGHEGAVNSVVISSNDEWIISASADKTIKIWELKTGNLIKTLKGHEDAVSSVAISSDCQWIISGSADKTIKRWKLETGSLIKTLKEHEGVVNSVAISSDCQWIVSSSADKTLRGWSLETGEQNHCIKQAADATTAIVNNRFILVGYEKDIKYLDTITGRTIYFPKIHKNFISALAVCQNGKTAISVDKDGIAVAWNIEEIEFGKYRFLGISFSNTAIDVYKFYAGASITNIELTNDGKYGLFVSGKQVNVYDLMRLKVLRKIKKPNQNQLIAISNDGKLAVSNFDTTSYSGNGDVMDVHKNTGLYIYELDDQMIKRENRSIINGRVVSWTFSADDKNLTSADDKNLYYVADYMVKEKFSEFKILAPAIRAFIFNEFITSFDKIITSNNSSILVSASSILVSASSVSKSNDKSVKIWDLKKRTSIDKLKKHADAVLAVAISDDGQWIASAGKDKMIYI